MRKLIDVALIIGAIVAVLFTAWNIAPDSWFKSFGGAGKDIVVVDMLKIDVAQRKFVAEMLKKEAGASSVASAFRATGDVIEAARTIAPNKTIAVKQAFLYSEYPDITNDVLIELGLDPSVEVSINADSYDAETSDIVNMESAVRDMKSKGVQLPY
jgi:hypothetical protein